MEEMQNLKEQFLASSLPTWRVPCPQGAQGTAGAAMGSLILIPHLKMRNLALLRRRREREQEYDHRRGNYPSNAGRIPYQ